MAASEYDDFWQRWLGERTLFTKMCGRWLQGRPHDIEDVLSLGALKAWNFQRANPDVVRHFRPWALRLLYNICVDVIRAQARKVALPPDEESATQPPTASVTTPERALHDARLASALERAVGTLPTRLRTAFELRFHDALPYTEISRVLEISPENARKRIQQARQRLREELGEYAS
jgi:RNA polymerase sigma-70 factor (ECF subfamily)